MIPEIHNFDEAIRVSSLINSRDIQQELEAATKLQTSDKLSSSSEDEGELYYSETMSNLTSID
jgi:hypothetical protein